MPGSHDRPHGAPLLRAYLAVSLDGYIGRADGDLGWLNAHFTPEIDFGAFAATIGATVFGRVTFEEAVTRGEFRGGREPGTTYVLTSSAPRNLPRGVEAFSGDPRELATRLRAQLAGTGKDVWLIGGGRAIASFHAAGLVDRFELSVLPVTLGAGVPLFPAHERGLERLRLVHSRALSNGIVELHYEPSSVAPKKQRARRS